MEHTNTNSTTNCSTHSFDIFCQEPSPERNVTLLCIFRFSSMLVSIKPHSLSTSFKILWLTLCQPHNAMEIEVSFVSNAADGDMFTQLTFSVLSTCQFILRLTRRKKTQLCSPAMFGNSWPSEGAFTDAATHVFFWGVSFGVRLTFHCLCPTERCRCRSQIFPLRIETSRFLRGPCASTTPAACSSSICWCAAWGESRAHCLAIHGSRDDADISWWYKRNTAKRD